MSRRAWCVIAAMVTLGAASPGCRSKSKADLSKDEVTALLKEYDRARAEEAKRLDQHTRAAPSASPGPAPVGPTAKAPAPKPEPTEPIAQVRPEAPAEVEGPWITDEPEPIAPAAPITATPDGVVLRNKADDILVALLGPLSRSRQPGKTPITRLPKSAGTFPLGPGAGVFGPYAYWISGGKLRRRKLPTKRAEAGPIESLADDARTGARVATPMEVPGITPAPLPQTVAYIVQPPPLPPGARPSDTEEPTLTAKLWTEGAEPLALTPEGAATHVVRLVRQRDGLLAISMHARMAMTPVHARKIEFEGGKPRLRADLVVWVGGGVQSHTEMTLLPGPGDRLWGFLPHERSITDFGVAELDIGQRPDQDTPTRWLYYPNGIDPAPLDVGYLCGEPVMLYAQPRSADPDAPQQLVLRSLTDGSDKAQEIARAEAFYSVSYSATKRGGLVAWVADWVTWAGTVRCREG